MNKEKSQQEEKVFKISESKLNAAQGQLGLMALTAHQHAHIQNIFNELKKE